MPDRSRFVPLLIACAIGMEMLDATIISTALPTIARDLRVDPTELSVAMTAYLLSLAVFIPLSGWVADRFGPRRVFQWAIAVFLLGSVCCGLSGSLTELVASRVLQGFGGAMMTPVARTIVLRSIPREKLIAAMALMAIPGLMGPLLGPPLGGLIVTYADWPWIFWINVPIGIVGFILAARLVPPLPGSAQPPFDLLGFAMVALGLGLCVSAFETVGRGVIPDSLVLGLFVAGLCLLGLFVLHARRIERPALDLELLAVPTFRAGIVGSNTFRLGMGAMPLLLPLMLQVGYGLSPLLSGLITMSGAAGAMLMKPLAPPLLRRLGFRTTLLAMSSIGCVCVAVIGFLPPDRYGWLLLLALLIGGVARSLHFTSAQTLTYVDVPNEQAGRAAAFASVGQQFAMAAGVAVGASFLHLFSLYVGDRVPQPVAFQVAFLFVGALMALSLLAYLRLDPEAGARASGHRRRQAAARPPEAIEQAAPAE